MIAYKFLAPGRHGRFSNYTWPGPGEWVRAAGTIDACRVGVHACEISDLPFWLDQELWTVELAGAIERRGNHLVAESGRLVELIEAWTPECAQEYADACARRGATRMADALRRDGQSNAADYLEAAATMSDLRSAAADLAPRHPSVQIAIMMVRDCARRAITGPPPACAYIAAHAAARVSGPSAYAAERQAQSQWLAERLALNGS